MASSRRKSTGEAGEIHFQVDSALLLQLGEQLVAKRSVALAELVKNAYDADATEVVLHLYNVKQRGGTIIVEDNGVGMTFDVVERAWMTIGTPEKIDNPISEVYLRPRTGDKGVGRFAARRLANQLRLRSVAEPQTGAQYRELVELDFDWTKFKRGQRVEQVASTFTRTRVGADEPCGVTLELSDTRDAWSEEDVRQLQRELAGLFSPFPDKAIDGLPSKGSRGDPGFSIKLIAEEFKEYSGKFEVRFLQSSYAKLEGFLSPNGVPEYKLTFRGEKKPFSWQPRERVLKKPGPLHFQIHFYVYQKDYFAGLDFSVAEARETSGEHAGVRIFFNKFRVPPYGNLGDDWLDLDKERAGRLTGLPSVLRDLVSDVERPMLLLPGNNQLFGAVFLSRERNPDLQMTLNRERLMENEAFRELKEFVRLGIDWLTVLHARRVEERTRTRDKSQPLAKPAKLVASARERLERSDSPIGRQERVQIIQALKLAEATFAIKEEEHISELSMLRVLASTGTMIVVFDHQLLGILNGLRESHENLQKFLGKLPLDERDAFKQVVHKLEGWIDDAEHQGELLGLLLGKGSRSRRRRWAIRPELESIESSFKSYMEEMGVDFINEVEPGIRVPLMFQCELMAILMNLMTNALKAVREQRIKRIGVSAIRNRDGVRVRFCDTGMGAQRDKWDEYFKPFVGESEPDPILGHGTGLGLKIVKDLADIYGGEARFIDPDKPWNTCVEIFFPEK
jgi:signal transduction histidine kinase